MLFQAEDRCVEKEGPVNVADNIFHKASPVSSLPCPVPPRHGLR